MPKRRPYRELFKEPLSDETTEYQKTNQPCPDGFLLYITTGAYEDEDNAPDSIAFGVMIKDTFYAMEEDGDPAAGVRYHLEKTHVFRPGEYPCWRVEGGTADDMLSGIIEGYLEEF